MITEDQDKWLTRVDPRHERADEDPTHSDAVWPDGAREAVTAEIWQHGDQTVAREADAILTALEPFVQQRIAEARPVCSVCAGKGTPVSGGACICGGVGTQAAELQGFRAEVARLREDGERRQSEVLQLRALVAALPIGECQASEALQGWWDQMKAVMAGTNPVWLVEPRGCPTPGACSCPGVRLDAARSAPGGEG